MPDTESRHDDGAKCEVCGEPSAGRTIDDVELCAMHGGLANGVSLIAAERKRQIEQEGWTSEHDDKYRSDELPRAAALYALPEHRRALRLSIGAWHLSVSLRTALWPWWPTWWKPTPDDRIRELTKAGALIAAEIDRLLRVRAEGRTDG